MLFRDAFLGTTGRPLGEKSSNWIARVTEGGFRVSLDLQKAQMQLLKSGFEHVAQTQLDASEALRGELTYQAQRLGQQIAQGSAEVVAAVAHGSANVVESIQRMSDYLGAGLSEVRWAVERHSRISSEILKTLVESLNNESRQYFQQGLKCYETNEYEFAKKTFNKALDANITNHFAYQYLGIIAVAENNADEALRNFELARKFAEDNYHCGLALSHLARSYHAIGDLERAADISKHATEIYPALAKFWYELAGYSSRLGHTDKAINSLKEAIERDLMFFAVVAGDSDFTRIRPRVNALLDSVREHEKAKCRYVLDDVRRALDLAKKSALSRDHIAAMSDTLNTFESRFKQNNVFVYREIHPQAEGLLADIFQRTEKALEQQIRDKRRQIQENDSSTHSQLYSLTSNLSRLEGESHKFDPQDFSTYAIAYLLLFIPIFFVTCFVNARQKPPLGDLLTESCGIAALIPLGLIVGFEVLRFIFGSAIPTMSVSRQKNAEFRRVNPQRKKIEDQFNRTRTTLERELRNLEELLAQCKTS